MDLDFTIHTIDRLETELAYGQNLFSAASRSLTFVLISGKTRRANLFPEIRTRVKLHDAAEKQFCPF